MSKATRGHLDGGKPADAREAMLPRAPGSRRMDRVALAAGLWLGVASFFAGASEPTDEAVPDAFIERWEQQWTIADDGSLRRRETQRIQLMNARPIRRFGDPRIDYRAGSETLTIHAARTHTPDGRSLDVPAYGFNPVGPGDTAGWPAYSDWQQQVVSFSGIEPGAVLELDYEIASPPGTWQWPGVGIRLDDEYPIGSRTVTVAVPASTTLRIALDDAPCAWTRYAQTEGDGVVIHTWEWSKLRAAVGEPQSEPKIARGPHLTFSTGPDEVGFVREIVARMESSASPDDAIRAYAAKVTKDEVTAAGRARALTKSFRERFNVVAAPRVLRDLACRPASEAYRGNYGNPLEAAAVLAAGIRSLGLSASTHLLVHRDHWMGTAPTLETTEGAVVVVEADGETLCFDPRQGELFSGRGERRRTLLGIDSHGGLARHPLRPEGGPEQSEVDIRGTLTLAPDGNAKGSLTLGLSGVFVDHAKTLSADGQRSLLGTYVNRVLTGFEITGHTVRELSPKAFRAVVEVKVKEPLKTVEKLRILRLGTGPAHLSAVPLPLEVSEREGAVQLADAFAERVELRVELPKGASPVVLPASMNFEWAASGALATTDGAAPPGDVQLLPGGGRVRQSAAVEDGVVVWRREISVAVDRIAAEAFAPSEPGKRGLREVLNDLRADASLLLAVSE